MLASTGQRAASIAAVRTSTFAAVRSLKPATTSGAPSFSTASSSTKLSRTRLPTRNRHLHPALSGPATTYTTRRYATGAAASKPSRVRVGTLFLALSILGLGATSLGLYNYYTSFKTWPDEIRGDLRSALRCKARQDYINSHKFYREAWRKILDDDDLRSRLGLLKVTGVAIAWSEMLEEADRRADKGSLAEPGADAYDTLTEAYEWGRTHLQKVEKASVEERMRVVSMAVKLGNLAEGQADLDEQSEKQLTWAVEEVLRLATQGTPNDASKRKSEDNALLAGELGLPPWVSKTDMGGTLETLGNLYARKGNVEYAMPLYLQTISLLLPPPGVKSGEPTPEEACHAATIMNNLSSLIASAPKAPSTEIAQTTQAFAWANKASQIAKKTLDRGNAEAEQCKPVLTVALYNLGMLKLLEGDKAAARTYLDQAKEKATEWGLKDAQFRATEVLKSL